MSSTAKLLVVAAALAAGAAAFLFLSGGAAQTPPGAEGRQETLRDGEGREGPAPELADVPADETTARAAAETEVPLAARGEASRDPLPAFQVELVVVPEAGSDGPVAGEVAVVERAALQLAGGARFGEAAHAAVAAASRGTSRVELAGSGGRVRLDLEGGFVDPVVVLLDRHWYAPVAAELDADLAEVTLEARRGACFVLRPSVTQGALVGSLSVSGFDMRGRRSGGAAFDIDLEGLEGEVLVRGVDPARAWTFIPEAEAHHCPLKSGVEIEPGAERVIEMAFVPGATVAGRVVDGAGNGLEGVELSTGSRMPWMGGRDARKATTERDGSFRMAGVAPGKVQLKASLEGWREPKIEAFEVADLERLEGLVIAMDEGASVSGTIVWEDGTPAEGARVRATTITRSQWGGWGGGRVRTEAEAVAAADGSYRLTGLGDGQFTIRASHRPDEASLDDSAPLWRATNLATADTTLDLTLVGPELLVGRVVDDRGEPLTAFEVVAKPAERGVRDERASFEDEEGRFQFARVGTGEWTLEARADGVVPSGEVAVSLPGTPGELTLRVDRTATITGKVLDPRGAPVSGAELRLDEPGGRRGGWGGGPRARATTDASGVFTIDGLKPGTTTLIARADGWADAAPGTFELAPAEEREGVVLTVREGGRIVGAVFDDAGDPVSNQRVNYGENSMGFGARGETKTAADGSFAFEGVTPGTWSVSASPSMEEMSDRMNQGGANFVSVMGELVTETVDVADGETVEVYLGGDPKIPVSITGVVTRGGQIVAGAEVYATSEGSAIFEGMKTAKADAEGNYELIVDRPGAYLVSAREGDAGVEVPVDAELGDGTEVDLAIPDTWLRGRVKRPDGEPAVGIQVAVQREDGLGRIRWSGDSATTNDDGRWEIPSLEPGVYTVRVNGSSWQRRSEKRWGKVVRTGVVLEEDATVDRLDFELKEAGTIAGVVKGTDGQPLGEATVFFRDQSGAFVDRVSGESTNAAGEFEAEGLAPGVYSLSVRMPGFASSDGASCTVRSGETSQIELQVDVGVMVEVNVVDGEGEPLRGRVEVFDRDDREVGAPRTVAQVRQQFNAGVSTFVTEVGPLPPGRYEVRVTTEDGRTEEKRLTIRASSDTKTVRVKMK